MEREELPLSWLLVVPKAGAERPSPEQERPSVVLFVRVVWAWAGAVYLAEPLLVAEADIPVAWA